MISPAKNGILTAFVIALLTAGTAPWWLQYLLEFCCNPSQPKSCAERSVQVPSRDIATSGADAQVVEGDSEIDSDDWTSIEVAYRAVVSGNGRVLQLQLTWFAQERNRDRTRGNTRIRSIKTFDLYAVDPSCPDLQIAATPNLTADDSNENYYQGQVHGPVPFPDTGALRNLRVQFDGPHDNDQQKQALSATVEPFEVRLKKAEASAP